ncbi:MAG: polysaccharide deacetylase family protein [Candidatus Magnetoovum sp. WYHC-5]|nr:polysaccharide deacetylase family protein [Candidatus Magnetoovum sp. WYHC-5]
MKMISLLYHDVINNNSMLSSGFCDSGSRHFKLSKELFIKHIDMVSTIPTYTVGLRVLDVLKSVNNLNVLFTFDDGGISGHMYIADILEKQGWFGHFFITAEKIGKPAFMNKNHLIDLKNRGHLIGTHSYSHPMRMSICDWNTLLWEWGESKNRLSDIIAEDITVGAIPGGYYSKKVAMAASQVGIKVLFTSEPVYSIHSVDDCIVLGRFTISRNTSPIAIKKIVLDINYYQLRQILAWNFKKIFKTFMGRHYLTLRKFLLDRCNIA